MNPWEILKAVFFCSPFLLFFGLLWYKTAQEGQFWVVTIMIGVVLGAIAFIISSVIILWEWLEIKANDWRYEKKRREQARFKRMGP